jgi:N-acetylmuramic acid 6-phosphate etherase
MVDLKMSNEKLRDRARRVMRSAVPESSSINIHDDDAQIDQVLDLCQGKLKPAILVVTLGCTPQQAEDLLQASGGSLKVALNSEKATEVSSNSEE